MSRFGTLRWRLTALYAAVAAVMLIVVLAIGGAVVETALLQSTAERLEIEAGLVVADATGGKRGPRATDLAAGDLATVLGGQGTAVVILDGAGGTLAAEPNGATSPIVTARLDSADYAAALAAGRVRDRRSNPAQRRACPGGCRARRAANTRPWQREWQRERERPGPGQREWQRERERPGPGQRNTGNGNAGVAEGPANAVAQLAVSLAPIDATLAQLRLVTGIVAGLVLVLAAASGVGDYPAWPRATRPDYCDRGPDRRRRPRGPDLAAARRRRGGTPRRGVRRDGVPGGCDAPGTPPFRR